MSLTAPRSVIEKTTHPSFASLRDAKHFRTDVEEVIVAGRLKDDALKDLIEAATEDGDTRTARAVEAILQFRGGVGDLPVPNFKAFQSALEAFLKKDLIDGWVYLKGNDGKFYPYLVTSIEFDSGQTGYRGKSNPSVKLVTHYYGLKREDYAGAYGSASRTFVFNPGDTARRRVSDIMAAQDLFHETSALKAGYETSMARYVKEVRGGFPKQFRANGVPALFEEDGYRRREETVSHRKVIHDTSSDDFGVYERFHDSNLSTTDGVGAVPEHPVIRVFDLGSHEHYWMHSDNMDFYVYDKSLGDKLILPKTHRDLLDVLTTDLDSFTEDIIEGKSAGNLVVCKGLPGVGKTLTAEVYSELVEKPLYKVLAGSLGTEVEEISKGLAELFKRSKRWDCVMLLDEADVFVARRGDNIELNAIVAEFLRTFEYFDGLMFATTNRPDDIDEAFLPRAIAVIHYELPDDDAQRQIWGVMSKQYKVELKAALVDQLVALFPKIAPRDIKMLLKLALKFSAKKGDAVDVNLFRKCGMFRAIKMAAG